MMLMLIVHSPEDVVRAPAGARLITPPDFCCYAGVGYGAVMRGQWSVASAQENESRITNYESRDILFGCGDDAAVVHDALRMGLTYIYTRCAAPMFAKLQAIARAVGAEITSDYPSGAIDMREWWAKNGAIAKQPASL